MRVVLLNVPLTEEGLPCGSASKESACNARAAEDSALIPGLGRSLGGGEGNPFQYSCLGNLMDRGAWQATVHEDYKESHTTEVT